MIDASENVEEVLVIEQTVDVVADGSGNEQMHAMTDDLMRRSSPDGSTDNDDDHEPHGSLAAICLFSIVS